MKAYFISGLGADKKAFYKLKLPAGYEPVYLDWIAPQTAESLSSYAMRMAELIDANEPFILIGLSFGGIVACEIAKVKEPAKLILLSSIACSNELPWYFCRAADLRLQKIIPTWFYKKATLLNHFMGSKEKDERALISSFVKQTKPEFIRWAIQAIVTWKHEVRSNAVVHIHGSGDKLLPSRYTKADFIIKNGRHLMVWNKAAEINEILQKVLFPIKSA